MSLSSKYDAAEDLIMARPKKKIEPSHRPRVRLYTAPPAMISLTASPLIVVAAQGYLIVLAALAPACPRPRV
jgi:hypothetical protein